MWRSRSTSRSSVSFKDSFLDPHVLSSCGEFRGLSLAGLILFWGVMGGLFQWLWSVNHHRRTEAHSS